MPTPFFRSRLAGVSVLTLAQALAGTAVAQTQPAPAPVVGPVLQLKPVVITARHRAERAQSVPVSLTVVGAAQIATVGSSNLNKIQELVPSLTIDSFNPRNTSVSIRGLGAVPNLANDGLEDGVGVYVDNVLLARPAQAVFDLPDIQDVEVLRGPQGTLFGKNTVAGAVNITTRLPSFKPEADGSISFGSQNYFQAAANASSALFGSENLAAGISYQQTQHEGWEKDLTNGRKIESQNDKGVRVQLLAIVTPELTVRTIFDYSDQDDSCCANQIFGYVGHYAPAHDGGAALPAAANALTHFAALGVTPPSDNAWARTTTDESNVHYHQQTGGASVQADYDLNGFNIASISAVRFWDWFPHNDSDLTALPILIKNQATVYQRQASQELRLTSPLGGFVDYTAGLYYFYQQLDSATSTTYGADAGAWITDSLPASKTAITESKALNGLSAAQDGLYYTDSYAAYGQARFHIAPKIDLTTGLRYTYEAKSGTYQAIEQDANPLGSAKIETGIAPIVPGYRVTADAALPAGLITLSYKPVDGVLTYATYSHGAKSQGINLISNNLAPKVVKPETIDNYEIGAKTTLFDSRVILDADLFWDEDKNYQATLIGFTPAGQAFSYVSGVPKVRSRGLEIDSQAQVTANLSVFASAAYDNAYYESNPAAPCPIELGGSKISCDLTGGRVAGESNWAGSFGGEYDQPLGEVHGQQLVAYATADADLRTGFYSSADDSAYSFVPGYGIGNLTFGVKNADARWSFSGWVRNFTDSHYYLYRSANGSFPTYNIVNGLLGDPITGGVTLTGKF